MSALKEYLGDSVYAEFDSFAIVLTTENGRVASNTIVLEPQVVKALNSFVERIKKSPQNDNQGKIQTTT